MRLNFEAVAVGVMLPIMSTLNHTMCPVMLNTWSGFDAASELERMGEQNIGAAERYVKLKVPVLSQPV